MDDFAEIGLGSVVVGGISSFLGVGALATPLIPVGIGLLVYGVYRSATKK
ncbi:MAG: hypothetical protein QXU98_07515 [Candidatus Parvarchaeota archaeon]